MKVRVEACFAGIVLLLVLGDVIFNRVIDWLCEAFCILLACALTPWSLQLIPRILSSVFAAELGLLGMMMHLGYTEKAEGVLWMTVCLLLSLYALTAELRGAMVVLSGWLKKSGPDPEQAREATVEGAISEKELCGCHQSRAKVLARWQELESSRPLTAKGLKVISCSCCGLVALCGGVLVVFLALTEQQCSVGTYFPSELLPAGGPAVMPMEIGTRSNIDTGISFDTIDLTGVWWIRWPYEEPIPGYTLIKLEELVSFAGMWSNVVNDTFPATLSAPTGRAFHWGFSNTVVSRIAMWAISGKNPHGTLNLEFSNTTHAFIGGGGTEPWYFDAIEGDPDRWLRTMDRSSNPHVDNMYYELTRIIFEDGTPHPENWPLFERHMAGTKIRVWTTSDRCLRQCGAGQFGTCSSCASKCNVIG